jgi:hypothetical protein
LAARGSVRLCVLPSLPRGCPYRGAADRRLIPGRGAEARNGGFGRHRQTVHTKTRRCRAPPRAGRFIFVSWCLRVKPSFILASPGLCVPSAPPTGPVRTALAPSRSDSAPERGTAYPDDSSARHAGDI